MSIKTSKTALIYYIKKISNKIIYSKKRKKFWFAIINIFRNSSFISYFICFDRLNCFGGCFLALDYI